jgi:mannose-6-phosphate isomerase-like protein (cupin superfamily)
MAESLSATSIQVEECLMNRDNQGRRSFLFALGGLAMSQMLRQGAMGVQTSAQAGLVLGADDGEHLIHFRDGGNIFIRFGAATGSTTLAMGTQQVMAGSGIPVHRHFKMDEAFSVLAGSGVVILDDVGHPFEKGATIFIPKNTWHAFENPQHELLLLWVVTPAGLDGFFRDTCNPPGVPPKQLTRERIREIAGRYDTEFR